ncbi:hypothetical protein ACSBR1_030251 [Camellia fascicularis]
MGEPLLRAQWDSNLFACLGRNDEFCSSDLEVYTLSLGMDRLQQTLAQSIIGDPISIGIYGSPMASAMGNLDAMESFVNQIGD